MTSLEMAPAVQVDHAAILRHLKLNPSDPNTQALLLVCERYHLDPLLKHMVLIQGTPYITRDGYLAVAHRSGQFDGLEVLETGETQTHYTAKVAAHRKDMSHPFTYVGRYKKGGGNKEYGPEMAVKCAEVMALRRAFNVTGVGAADERWDTTQDEVEIARQERAEHPLINVATGEIVAEANERVLAESTTRRREPPHPKVPDGHTPALTAMKRIMEELAARGITEDEAKKSANVLWGERSKKDPVPDADLAEMVEALGPVQLFDEEPFDE